MRVTQKSLYAVTPRAALLAAAALTLSLALGLAVAGCGAADPSANNGDAGRPAAAANVAQPAVQTTSPVPASSSAAPGGAAGGATSTNAAADASAGARDTGASPGGAPAEEEADSSAQDFEGTAGLTEKKREVSGVAVLREVRSASHPGFDRVVFVFDGNALPGHRVEYVDRPVRQCGSGRPVRVAGDAWLLVRLEPANAHTEAGEPTVNNRERRLSYPNLKELKIICDFEAQVEWVLGLGSPNRYRVLELRNPARLVVDVKR
jgi:hypothetical protein